MVYFNRVTKHPALIEQAGATLTNPHLSDDLDQMLFVRHVIDSEVRELITCKLDSWACRILLRTTNNTLFSPTFVDSANILYASSPIPKRPERLPFATFPLPAHWDFYSLKIGSEPKRLTSFQAGQLSSINVFNSELIFDAIPAGSNHHVFPKQKIGSPHSDIFALPFNSAPLRVATPSEPLHPMFVIEGTDYSISPAAPHNGKYVAFLNTRGHGSYLFNLVLAQRQGEKVLRYIETDGYGFSRPAFADGKVVANELLDDRYRISEFEMNGAGTKVLFEMKLSENAIKPLDRIDLTFVSR